jgi:hypothetical protein
MGVLVADQPLTPPFWEPMDFGNTPNKLYYQWSFSYLTGFTGSIGFSFLFLSFLKKLRKKNPATREK